MIDQNLVKAFYNASIFLRDRIENHGWKKFSSNYLREHVRCRYGLKFSNTVSPQVLRELRRQHPELKAYLDIHALKD